MNSKRQFSPAEWQVLEYVNEHHSVSAREAALHFSETQGWARTTTLTLMERLRRKGYLDRKKEGGRFRYGPAAPRAQMQRSLIRDFVDKALGGAVSPLLAFIGEDVRLSEQDLEDLKRLAQRLGAASEQGEE